MSTDYVPDKTKIGHLEYMVKTGSPHVLSKFLRTEVEENDCKFSRYYETFLDMSEYCTELSFYEDKGPVIDHFCRFASGVGFEYVLEKMARLRPDLFLKFSKFDSEKNELYARYLESCLMEYDWFISEDLFLQTADEGMRNEYLDLIVINTP